MASTICKEFCQNARDSYNCLDDCHTMYNRHHGAELSRPTELETEVTRDMTSSAMHAAVTASFTNVTCPEVHETADTWCHALLALGWILLLLLLAGNVTYFIMWYRKKKHDRTGVDTGSKDVYDPETGVNRELLHDEASRCSNNEQQQKDAVVRLNFYPVEGRGVFGAAIHDAKIYLIQCECSCISIFEAVKPFHSLGKIHVPGMMNPSDLLALDKCLYIPDDMNPHLRHHPSGRNSTSHHCVWKISLSGSEHPEKMLTSLGEWWPWALSRTSDGSQIIITTSHRDKITGTYNAHFWSPGTSGTEPVRLPSDVHSPQHVIELSCGSYLLCHDPLSDSRLNKVCILVRRGDEMQLIDSPSVMNHLLDKPEHLAELPGGSILVADFYNNCLLAMAKDLKRHKVLLRPKKGGKKRPCRIAYDSCKSLLLVAFHHSAGLYLLNDEFIRASI